MEEIAPNIFVENNYPGVNLGVIVASEGIICVDSPPRLTDAQEWIARVRNRFDAPLCYLILTDYHIDRTITAHAFRTRIISHQETQAKLAGYEPRFPAPALDSVAARYALERRGLDGIPAPHPQVSFCDQATVHLGERKITLLHVPSATHGSLWIYLKEDLVLFTGDTIIMGQHPPLAEANSKGWLDALVHLRRARFKARAIVPGRGRVLCNKSATEPVSAYVRLARRRVYSLYRAGRPRADTTTLIPEFLPLFPHPDAPKEWLQRQLKMGLDHIYDEYKAAKLLND